MATRDTGWSGGGISRRDFLKTTAAAGAVVGCGLEFAYDPEKAAAYEDNTDYKVSFTTCPYCSASCGQRVVTDADDNVIDIYGDFESPLNSGGLCAKGAGSLQLATNNYRIGAWAGTHPIDNMVSGKAPFDADGTSDAVVYKRTGNGNWTRHKLADELPGIVTALKTARSHDASGWVSNTAGGNSKSVAFFGSSHMNNEPNYLYRKIVAEFGTSNVEHQARI